MESRADLSSPRLIKTPDGIKLNRSILWFDARQSGELSFLSSALTATSNILSQVITTDETVRICSANRKKLNALVCQYNRPFSVGKLKMELLPTGGVLGGASLYVESDKERILYAPNLQSAKNLTVRQLQLKKANTLILGSLVDPSLNLPNRRKEKERLETHLESLRSSQDKLPVIFCPALGSAQEITKILSDHDIPVACHSAVYKYNKIYDSCGSRLGNYSLYSRKYTRDKAVIFPSTNRYRYFISQGFESHPIITIDDGLSGQTVTSTPVFEREERFLLAGACDYRELREIITAVNPKQVLFFGPYAKKYVELTSSFFKNVRPLYDHDQPTLF